MSIMHHNYWIYFQHEEEFLYIISAVKGGPGEKRLASQFVTRFFKYFPKLAFQAINALFDLCEDEDINVSIQQVLLTPVLYILYTQFT